ncbi:MAG: FAD-dependent oxidoreductase [Myxococcaceae bacterium]
MADSNALRMQPPSDFTPGIDGFTFADLYAAAGLQRLTERFFAQVEKDEPSLAQSFAAYKKNRGEGLAGPQESELLVRMGRHLSAFVGKLFRVEENQKALAETLTSQLPLFEFKREFITRRVYKKGAPDRPGAREFHELDKRVRLLLSMIAPVLGHSGASIADDEAMLARTVLTLLEIERTYANPAEENDSNRAKREGNRESWKQIYSALMGTDEGRAEFGSSLVMANTAVQQLFGVRALISLFDRWTFARALHPEGQHQIHGWSTHQIPKPLDYGKLVELKVPNPDMPEGFEGPDQHLRRRDGFKLTDRRMDERQVMDQVDYCVICHEREKDTCSKGFLAKDPVTEGNTYKKNPLGIPLTGCPLDERISEMHALKGKGDSVGALAMVMLDNPMCPGTGHRICNDCMKACIYQKQEPVNIPQIETSALTDVLKMPFGFEIYGLFTRWNPLNVRRPYALPYIGKNVLVVGLGPAGYTLAHYLLNEGFGVVGMDGLKIEPFPDEWVGRNGKELTPIRDFFGEIASELDDRVLAGFGGVSEYGITVRWDKSFLTLIHLTLARRQQFQIYGGIRFGGTLTIEDAWQLGFDHIAIAAGAGKPTLIGMKNNLIRGIRKASDFLMALQLTGAFKKDSLANLQVQLPAVVIGGGLTGIDTATELLAYYPVQVEKILDRHEKLSAAMGEELVFSKLDREEQKTLRTFLEHGKAVRAERKRAEESNELPDFIKLIRSWGGVSLCYRRTLNESPAYRLNHEEVAKALEEGIRFIERVSPVEAIPDETGAVKAVRFERMTTKDGKLNGSGEFYELPARTVCVAAGTSPNVTYEKERPGSFQLDHNNEFFQGYEAIPEGDGFKLEHVQAKEDFAAKVGFFTSYQKDGKFISFYGDNHPTYAGNVVKAMASAKDGHPHVAKLFEKHVQSLNFDDTAAQSERDRKLSALFKTLDEELSAKVVAVNRLTPTIVEVVVKAPFAAKHFEPGQFYRLQNFERLAPTVDGTRLTMEGVALTGAWVDKEKGLMSTIVLEMGTSSRLCATLKPNEPIVCMGPTGTPTEIPHGETVLLAGGGLGNAVLFSIGRAMRAAGCKVIYFAGYRLKTDSYKHDEIEAAADQVIWSVDQGEKIPARRAQDVSFVGNVVQAMVAYAKGELGVQKVAELDTVNRIIAIGSDRMMNAVKLARHGVLQPYLQPNHEAIGSINSPMQCMMKEICAQCLQKHVDPATGKEFFVFSCFNQDQKLDSVDFGALNQRLKANSVTEKVANLYLDRLLQKEPGLKRV